ncbi:helix-turn-helix domain-containing protein [Rhizobium sp. SL86]|uniref:helix-turn-helix domain-containing protein n=1 Tax=Rhizobium sp. SL86 TaxID=2995148 RepID=UPI00227576D3|nr:helix-turn-helix domain-containing protein [Rhizobium sp. SL86]MCY1664214.1 transposase [Rhizobium sp. SL86]
MTYDLHPSADPSCVSQPIQPRPSRIFAAPSHLPMKEVCRLVRQVVGEIISLTGDRTQTRRDRRRMLCHVRQIAMYVCHVSLSIPLTEIGQAFGRDRTTVGHACHVVEDRRDDAAFDDFITGIERIVSVIFARGEEVGHD